MSTTPNIGGYASGYRRDGSLTATQLQAIDYAERDATVAPERVDPGPEQGPECGCHPLNSTETKS